MKVPLINLMIKSREKLQDRQKISLNVCFLFNTVNLTQRQEKHKTNTTKFTLNILSFYLFTIHILKS